MMYESCSPFDKALSKPFLAEPAKKKWSLRLSTSTAHTVSTILSDYYYDESDDESVSSGEYEAPDMEEEMILFNNGDHRASHEMQQTLEGALQPMDVEAALIKERHGSFKEVHQSMSQIAEIQKDLSALIDSQDEDIENLQSMSIEASEQAQAGVTHLIRINQQREMMQQRRAYFLLTSVMIVGAFWVFITSADSGDGDMMP